MKIEYVIGDFINGQEQTILHGCNAQGVMGRGAALAIKTRLPWAFDAYRREYEAIGLPLGHVVWAYEDGMGKGNCREVGNMITQNQWHPSYGVNADYHAIRHCFRAVNQRIVDLHYGTVSEPPRVGMVKIGAGLAGGDWNIISKIIEDESIHFVPVVYVLDAKEIPK